VPGPEVHGADVVAGHVVQVVVDVNAAHVVPGAVRPEREQLLARILAPQQRADHRLDVAVGHGLDAFLAALDQVGEAEAGSGQPDVLATQRGQPVGAVLLGVLLAADPEEAEVQHPYGARQHALAGEPTTPEVIGDRLPRGGQPMRHLQDPSCFSRSRRIRHASW